MPEVSIPTPGELAAAGPWAVFAFLAICVIALAFYLLLVLLKREWKRNDATEAELKATKEALQKSNKSGTEAATELRRLRRLVATYEDSNERLTRTRRRAPRRRSDDA